MSETPENALRALLKERLPDDLPPIAQELIDGMIEVVREAVATSTAETAKVYEARLEREMVRAAELEGALREAQRFIIPYAFGQEQNPASPASPTNLYKHISKLLSKGE